MITEKLVQCENKKVIHIWKCEKKKCKSRLFNSIQHYNIRYLSFFSFLSLCVCVWIIQQLYSRARVLVNGSSISAIVNDFEKPFATAIWFNIQLCSKSFYRNPLFASFIRIFIPIFHIFCPIELPRSGRFPYIYI